MGLFDKLIDDVLGDPFGTYHQADQARIAGDQQAALADEGVREARRQFNFGRLAMQPYTDAGYEALGVGNYLTQDAIMSGNAGPQAAPGAGLRDKGRVKPSGGLRDMTETNLTGSFAPDDSDMSGLSLVPRTYKDAEGNLLPGASWDDPRVTPDNKAMSSGVSRVPAKDYNNPSSSYYDPNWNTSQRILDTQQIQNATRSGEVAPATLRQLGQFGLRSMPGLQDQAARGSAQMGALEEASAAGLRGLSRQEQLAAEALASGQRLDDVTLSGLDEIGQASLDAQRGREAQRRQAFRDESGLGASDRASSYGAQGVDSRGRLSQFELAGAGGLGQVQGLSGRTGGAADRMGAYEGAGAEGLGALGGFSQAGADALEAQRSLAGLNGAEAQAAAMADIESDPEYQMMLKEGEEAILQNASATGGLRGGKTQEALADLRSSLAARQLDKKYSRLGQLAQQGADISRFMSGQGQQATSNVLGLSAGAAEGLAARGQQASLSGAQMGLGADQFLSGQGAAASGQLMNQGGAASRGLMNMGYGNLQNQYATGVDLTRNLAGQGLNTAQYMTGLGGNLGQYLASTGASTVGDIARMGQASAAGQATLGQNTGGQVANLLGQKGAALAGGRIAGASGGTNAMSNIMGLTGAVSGFF